MELLRHLDMAEHFVNDDQMVVILGDNVFADSIALSLRIFVKRVRRQNSHSRGP